MVKKTTHTKAAKLAGQFILDTALIAMPLYLIFSASTTLHEIAARSSQFVLSLLGKTATLTFNGVPHLILPGLDVEINNLCSGALELSLLAGFIYASKDRSSAYRLKGVAAGFIFFAVFNALRIAFTINSFGTIWFQPLHEALFRAILIIGLVTYYSVWYYWK